MIKLSRVCLLAVAWFSLATAAGWFPSAVQGQDPKAAPPEAKKDEKKAEAAGVIEVYKAKDGWRFRVKNAEGKSVAIGTVGFPAKEDALRAIEMVKATLNGGKLVEISSDKK